jgi:hypothetical protein
MGRLNWSLELLTGELAEQVANGHRHVAVLRHGT